MTTPLSPSLLRARAAAELGRHALVEQECRTTLANDPRVHEAYELLAWSLMEQRRHDEALAVANEGLQVRADRAHLHYLAAVVLHRMEHLVAAALRAEAALALAPRAALYHVRLARILLDQGQGESAVARARQGLALAPESSFVLGEVARVLCEAGSTEEGCALAARRVRLFPDDVWALAGQVRALADARSFDALVEVAHEVMARNPNVPWVWSLYAEALDARGEYAAADAAIREAVRLHPHTRLGGVALARWLCEQQQWSRAEQAAQSVLDRDPDNPRASALLARARRRG
jgi:predicted Zn-dependent protease